MMKRSILVITRITLEKKRRLPQLYLGPKRNLYYKDQNKILKTRCSRRRRSKMRSSLLYKMSRSSSLRCKTGTSSFPSLCPSCTTTILMMMTKLRKAPSSSMFFWHPIPQLMMTKMMMMMRKMRRRRRLQK